jgi:hypothetical protein
LIYEQENEGGKAIRVGLVSLRTDARGKVRFRVVLTISGAANE